MRVLLILVAAAVLVAGAGVLFVLLQTPQPAAVDPREFAALRDEVAGLRAAQDVLLAERKQESLQPAAAPALERTPDLERMVQEAVAGALASRGLGIPPPGSA